MRDIATRLLAGKGQERAVVVLGDLNDGPDGYHPDPARAARFGDRHRWLDHKFVSHRVTHLVGDGDVTAGALTGPAPASIADSPNADRDARLRPPPPDRQH